MYWKIPQDLSCNIFQTANVNYDVKLITTRYFDSKKLSSLRVISYLWHNDMPRATHLFILRNITGWSVNAALYS